MISDKLKPFGPSIFPVMTSMAEEHGAINLSQGFPDFEGPAEIVEAAVQALRDGEHHCNQYARAMGDPVLTAAISDRVQADYGLEYDPLSEVVVTCGATEALTSAMLGLLNAGDEVILFEPFYDSYPAAVAMAGAVPRYCTLRFPEFILDLEELRGLFSERTRMLLLNTPHNPTGKVFRRAELEAIAALCREHDVIVLSDEVYEALTFDGVPHVPMATLPGMRERTITASSAGKTFSFTGWKIGWATGSEDLLRGIYAAHQYVTFTVARPLQLAVAEALRTQRRTYIDAFRADYTARRDLLVEGLRRAGFEVAVPRGTYFILAAFDALWNGDDMSFARHLVESRGVAAIPPSSFYAANVAEGRRLLRFSFAKRLETLAEAVSRLTSA